ncbi:MAG: ParB/RepB/Spo0J family partition protein [Rhodospirillaceae bacterium]|nr:ParB/RepB/Spo0J family partition protein [Rhodospirillaceae bacterium]
MTDSNEGRRRNLGRGLSALLGDSGDDYSQLDRVRGTKAVPVEQLRPGKFQPRRHFSPEDMEALVASVREKGILQPILVRRDTSDPNRYEIIAGERRWRAAQAAQLHEIPVLVRDLSDSDALEVALIENVQRQDLSPLEEAEGYRRLMAEFSHTQDGLAQAIGKSRSHIANMLRLLSLPEEVQKLLDSRALSAGHARALLNLPDPVAAARQVVRDGLSVRQTERLGQAIKDRSSGNTPTKPPKDADTKALERRLSETLGLRVEIAAKGRGGKLVIGYRDLDQLQSVVEKLSG